MSFVKRENSGSLFPNQNKKTDNHPSMTGTINVGGTLYELSAWTKVSDSGRKWMSLSVRPQGERQSKPQQKVSTRTPADAELNDDIPF